MLVRRTPLEKLLLLSRFTCVRAGVVALFDRSAAGLSRLSMRAIDDRRSDAKLCKEPNGPDVVAGVESRLKEFFQWVPVVLFSKIVDPIESLLLTGSLVVPAFTELAVESLLWLKLRTDPPLPRRP